MIGALILNTLLFVYLFLDFYNNSYKSSGENQERVIRQAKATMGNVCIPNQYENEDVNAKIKSS